MAAGMGLHPRILEAPGNYFSSDAVTRAQMATFMRRLAGGDGDVAPVVEAAHALQADWADDAGDADTLQGMGPAELLTSPAVINRWQHVYDDGASEEYDTLEWKKVHEIGDPVVKEHDDTDLRMRLTTHLRLDAGWSCVVQLRVDGDNRLGEDDLDGSDGVLHGEELSVTAVQLDVLFDDLDAGEHQVELWLRGVPDGQADEDAECMENPGGYDRLLVVEEVPGV